MAVLHISIFSLQETDEAVHFLKYFLKYFYFFSATEGIILDGQIKMECFQQAVSVTNFVSYSIFEAKLLRQQFGHRLDSLHMCFEGLLQNI